MASNRGGRAKCPEGHACGAASPLDRDVARATRHSLSLLKHPRTPEPFSTDKGFGE